MAYRCQINIVVCIAGGITDTVAKGQATRRPLRRTLPRDAAVLLMPRSPILTANTRSSQPSEGITLPMILGEKGVVVSLYSLYIYYYFFFSLEKRNKEKLHQLHQMGIGAHAYKGFSRCSFACVFFTRNYTGAKTSSCFPLWYNHRSCTPISKVQKTTSVQALISSLTSTLYRLFYTNGMTTSFSLQTSSSIV